MLYRGMSKLQHKERRDTCVYTSASVSNRTGILVLGGGGSCSPAADFFFCAISGAGQEREPSVHYDTCRDPRRGPWRCSERSTSLKWLFFSRSQVRVNGKPYNLSFSLSTARSHLTFFSAAPIFGLVHNISPMSLSPLLLSATMQLHTASSSCSCAERLKIELILSSC